MGVLVLMMIRNEDSSSLTVQWHIQCLYMCLHVRVFKGMILDLYYCHITHANVRSSSQRLMPAQ